MEQRELPEDPKGADAQVKPETVKKKTAKKATKKKAPDRATALARARQQKEAEAEAKRREADNAAFVYYLKCPRIGTHHAAYLVQEPTHPRLTKDDWYSSYKKVGEPHHERTLFCQECAMSGEQRRWNVAARPDLTKTEGYNFTLQGNLKAVVGKVSRAEFDERIEMVNEAVGEEVL